MIKKTESLTDKSRPFRYQPSKAEIDESIHLPGGSPCSAPGSLDTSLSHAAGLIEIAVCHA